MSSLDYRFLLIQASIDTNKEDADDTMKKVIDTLSSIFDKLIEKFDHIFHQYRISSQDNDVEDDWLSETTKSTSKTNPSKSDPSSFRKPAQLVKVAYLHQLVTRPWQVGTTEGFDGIAEDNIWQ